MDYFAGQVLNWKLEQWDRQRILKKELGDWSGILKRQVSKTI
jgi:hypothetical protein